MRILVAEDDAPLADAFREQLSREQFAVQTVSNGLEAQKLAADQPYDKIDGPRHKPDAGGQNDPISDHALCKGVHALFPPLLERPKPAQG